MRIACLLDTSVISESSKPNANVSVLRFIEAQDAAIISALTLHEITYGVERLPHGKKRDALRGWLATLKESYATRIVAIDDAIAETAGRFRAFAQMQGWDLDVGDSFIAATAHHLAIPLATRNVRHFEKLKLALINPWSL